MSIIIFEEWSAKSSSTRYARGGEGDFDMTRYARGGEGDFDMTRYARGGEGDFGMWIVDMVEKIGTSAGAAVNRQRTRASEAGVTTHHLRTSLCVHHV